MSRLLGRLLRMRGGALGVVLLPALFSVSAAQAQFTQTGVDNTGEVDIHSVHDEITDQVKAKLAELEAAAKADPPDAIAIGRYGYALMRVGKFPESFNQLNRALTLAPDEPQVILWNAKVLWKAKRLDEAEGMAQRLIDSPLASQSIQADGYLLLGSIKLERNELDKAEEIFRTGVSKSPNSGPLYMNLGLTLCSQKRKADCMSNLGKALKVGKSDFALVVRLARVFDGYGEKQQAKSAWMNAVALRPQDPDLRVILASRQFGDEEYEQCVANLKEVVKIKPDDSTALLILAQGLMRLKKYDEATVFAQKAKNMGIAEAEETLHAIEMERKQ